MGMFDTLLLDCPGCGHTIKIQSKGGPCKLRTYHARDVNPGVAYDLIGDSVACEKCGTELMVDGAVRASHMRLVETDGEEDNGL